MPNSRTFTNGGDGDHGSAAELDLVRERIAALVAQRPWTMLGAAAGLGLACGAASRTNAARDLTRTAAATGSGIAVRFALDALAQWFERARARE